mmetsp:Transcript_12717/g.32222  ORF Transcript_12717/g.32222 Transcript_12717/m.32222 type:complete len:185 (+) Transcript_12717:128-682(+)
MVLVLCIGDMHVPYRTAGIPQQFKDMLLPGKIQYILCTGDLCSKEMYDYLKTVCTNLHVVKGQFDDDHSYPERKVVQVGDLKFGLQHGHNVIPWGDSESLGMVQREMDVDVLVTGHTHALQCVCQEKNLLINPGSATGAYSHKSPTSTPSFCLLDVDGAKVTIYTYRLVDGELKKEKSVFNKSV